jgi:hypothetical protein
MSGRPSRPLYAAARAFVRTFVMSGLIVGMWGVSGGFRLSGAPDAWRGVVRASEGVTRGCAEVVGDRQRLRVRLVPAKNVDDAMLNSIKAEVSALWRDYSVDIIFEGAWSADDPDRKLDLFVYFVDRELTTPARRGASAVAWIMFVDGAPSQMISVSLAAADRLVKDAPYLDARPMRMAPYDMQRALVARMAGRALAHEIGHYLLASSTHAVDGLMRPLISPAEFTRIGRQHLRLMPDDVRRLRTSRQTDCQLLVSR